jgi:sulfatase modifying factor 1
MTSWSPQQIDAAVAKARVLADRGDEEGAAAVLDEAARHDRRVVPALQEVLVRLSFEWNGLTFRYVPAGTFTMGNDIGEPDEQPAHLVRVDGFWLTDAPLSWNDFARVLDWPAPPESPSDEQLAALVGADQQEQFGFYNDSKIRLQYCENETKGARDWHAHSTSMWQSGGEILPAQAIFGTPDRESPLEPYRYDQKPVVAVDWSLADAVARFTRCRLPTEAEWERAARGCFPSSDWPWGDVDPDGTRADYGQFTRFALTPSRAFAPNDYGLFSMSGGVWEWCHDHYDAFAYAERAPQTPNAPHHADAPHAPRVIVNPRVELGSDVKEPQHVLRGGSWSDDPSALRVSFRFASNHGAAPNIGFRLATSTRR